MKPHILIRKLNVNVSALFNDFGIAYVKNDRSADRKTFSLVALPQPKEESDTAVEDGTANDTVTHDA